VLSALKLSALGALAALVGSAALAGDAPAAFYPSLGYGQSYPVHEVAPGGYVDTPAYVGEPAHGNSYGPPPGYRGPGPCDCAPPPPPPPPPVADCHCVTHRPLPPPGPPIVYQGGERRGYAEHGFQGEHVYGEVRREDYEYDSGWRYRRIEAPPVECPYAHMPAPHPVCGGGERERYEESERLPDLFFADAGGVGPDEFEGGGGGGGGVVVGGEAGASAGAFAFASASAHASASIGIRIGRHGGGGHHGGGHMPHGCGCKK